jgi:uncharacterized protein (DUF433 family)
MNQLIMIHPEIQSGAPVFYNTRVPIRGLFDYLKGRHTIDEFLDDFPSVKREQAIALLDFVQTTLSFDLTLNVPAAA